MDGEDLDDIIESACYFCAKNSRKTYKIKRYGYKPNPKFKQVDNAKHPNLFFGVENEVNFENEEDAPVNAASKI